MDYRSGSKENDKMGKNIARLVELVSEHIDIMQEEEKKLIRITKKTKEVEQPFRNILELRFVEGMKIEEVAVEIDKTYRYTKSLVRKAIKEYAKL